MNQLVDAVKVTLGPKGRNVVLEKKCGAPTVTNDGVTIAKEIELEDPFENIGAQLVKEVATKTDDVAGDGTTTATVLAESLIQEGLASRRRGHQPHGSLKRGIPRPAAIAVATTSRRCAKDIKEKDEIAQVAAISPTTTTRSATLIADAMEKVGKDGVITVEESKTRHGDEPRGRGRHAVRPRLHLARISSPTPTRRRRCSRTRTSSSTTRRSPAMKDLLPLLEKIVQTRQAAARHRRRRRRRGARHARREQAPRHASTACAVKAPGFGDRRKAMLAGHRDPHRRPGHRRGARAEAREHRPSTCSAGPSRCRGQGKHHHHRGRRQAEATSRTASARSRPRSTNTDSDYDREKLQERLAKLAGGVAVINVGAATEVELKEKKHRIEDALSTTKAAIEEGIVPGGGVALLRASRPSSTAAEKLERRRGDRRMDRGAGRRGAAEADRGERRPRGRRRRREGRGT